VCEVHIFSIVFFTLHVSDIVLLCIVSAASWVGGRQEVAVFWQTTPDFRQSKYGCSEFWFCH